MRAARDFLRLVVGVALATEASAGAQARRPIEVIVVTAQKKAEPVVDVPISISVFDGAFLEDAGIDLMHELVQRTPNVFLSFHECCPTIFVRGFGTPYGTTAFEPTV